ncbi:MAG: AAC(6')-Ia family aminoglycoside 6'-N-acetyltransferase [Saccharospirillum sp.]
MTESIRTLTQDPALQDKAADILMRSFLNKGNKAWPTMASARKELTECLAPPNFCLGAFVGEELAGWVGLRPMYETTWELHPLVVSPDHQGVGLGRRLLKAIEQEAKAKGLIGIVLGTDDEHDRTSLSQQTLNGDNLLNAMQQLTNLNHHPFEFYQKCGYSLVGVIPNANGRNKPDIWMWKDLSI